MKNEKQFFFQRQHSAKQKSTKLKSFDNTFFALNVFIDPAKTFDSNIVLKVFSLWNKR